MSDAPQGPGWWLASDGKWYPPQQAPGAQPQPPPQQQPPAQPPPQPPPPGSPPAPAPAKPAGGWGKGCTYALIAVAAVGALAVIGIVLGLAFLGDKVSDDLEEAVDDDPCPFLSDADARSVFGDGVEAIELSGLNQLLEITGDNRVLANAPACIVRASSGDFETIARVARYQGGDAASVFDAEHDVADGTSEDQGGGISLETSAYLSDQAVDSGDEGFCTTANITGASGALVRQGDTLVYVSVQPDLTSEAPRVDLDSGGFATDPENCAKAQELAEQILG